MNANTVKFRNAAAGRIIGTNGRLAVRRLAESGEIASEWNGTRYGHRYYTIDGIAPAAPADRVRKYRRFLDAMMSFSDAAQALGKPVLFGGETIPQSG